jgi:hypothetical protein
MSQKPIIITACLLLFTPTVCNAGDCSLRDIAKSAQAAASSATSGGQEQSRKLAIEAQRITAANRTLLNVVPETQTPDSEKIRLADLKQRMTYLRVHQHYIAEARSLEADIAEIAEVAQLLTSGASVKEGEPGAKAADALYFLRQSFPEPKTEIEGARAASACDLPFAINALQRAAADELNAMPLREPLARIQKAAQKYGLDMSKTAWGNPNAWLSAIPSFEERKRVGDDMALVWKARLKIAFINDLQNLMKLYSLSRKRLQIHETELAQLARGQALEHLGDAWSAYISAASPEEKRLNELLDFVRNKGKGDGLNPNTQDPRAP